MIILRLDKNGGINKGDIKAFEHDNKSETYIIQLYKNNKVYDLTNKTVELTIVEKKRKYGDVVTLPVEAAAEGKVKLEIVAALTKQDGTYDFKLTVKDTAGLIETFPNFQVKIDTDITKNIAGEIAEDKNFTIITEGLKALGEYEVYKTNAKKVPDIEKNVANLGSQLETKTKQLDKKIDEVAQTGTTVEVIQNKVSEMAQNGSITFNTITPNMTTFIINEKSENLFNLNSVLNDKYLQGGLENDLLGLAISDFIEVIPGEKYYCSYTASVSVLLATYKKGKIYYNDIKKTSSYVVLSEDNSYFEITIPPEIYYVRLNTKMTMLTQWVFSKGKYLNTYEQYFNENYISNNIKLSKSEEIINLQNNVEQLKNSLGNFDVIAIKKDDVIRFRTKFSSNEDIVLDGNFKNTNNGTFNFKEYGLLPTTTPKDSLVPATGFKNASDDICPLIINNSYQGGNHGIGACVNHGKTIKDIGSIYTDANNYDYIIMKIVDSNTLWVVSDYQGNPYLPIRKNVPVTPLTHKLNGTNTSDINFTKSVSVQILPSSNNVELKIINNKGEELNENGILYGEYIDIVEKSNLIDAQSMIEYLKNNVGKCNNESYYNDTISNVCTSSIIYRINKNMSCTTYHSYCFNKNSKLGQINFIQSQSIGKKIFVPDTIYDDITTMVSGNTITFDSKSYREQTKLPYRYFQLSEAEDKGFALGYHLDGFNLTNEERKLKCLNVGNCNGSTFKMYPQFINDGILENGTYVGGISYRIPFLPNSVDSDITSIIWYWVGNEIILMIDCHKIIDKYIKLPNYMQSKKIEILDKHKNTIINQKFIDSFGLKFKNTENYGYAVLKLI